MLKTRVFLNSYKRPVRTNMSQLNDYGLGYFSALIGRKVDFNSTITDINKVLKYFNKSLNNFDLSLNI